MKTIWKRFLAFMHWSNTAVCEMSCRGDGKDYHDYYDSEDAAPPMSWYNYKCKRCGKEFTI